MAFIETDIDRTIAEIRDVNAKSISIGKLFGLAAVAFAGYITAGLAILVRDLTHDQITPGSLTVLVVKIYSLGGIAIATILLVCFCYLLRQWGVSKTHRIRNWRHIAAMRGHILKQHTFDGMHVLRRCNLLPVNDIRPHIERNMRCFGYVACIVAFLCYCAIIVLYTLGFHIDTVVGLHDVEGLQDKARSTKMIYVFAALMAPSLSFVFAAWAVCCRQSGSFYKRIVVGEASSARDPFPRLPIQWERRINCRRHAALLIGIPAFFIILVMGARVATEFEYGHVKNIQPPGETVETIAELSQWPSSVPLFSVYLVCAAFCLNSLWLNSYSVRVLKRAKVPKTGLMRIEALRGIACIAQIEGAREYDKWRRKSKEHVCRHILECCGREVPKCDEGLLEDVCPDLSGVIEYDAYEGCD